LTAEITKLPPRDPFFALAPELRLHLSEADGALVVNNREVARLSRPLTQADLKFPQSLPERPR
jgi:hypothetical protein